MAKHRKKHRACARVRIGILSGKGGTGKTTVSAALAAVASDSLSVVSADCDVDAANLAILLSAEATRQEPFMAGSLAVVDDPDCCSRCGTCQMVCRFDAIPRPGEIEEIFCEGCGACAYHCPEDAITIIPRRAGMVLLSETQAGPLVHGELDVGAGNSGKMVAEIRRRADRLAEESGADLVLVDGPPGIGCPVLASLPGLDAVVLVTEPAAAARRDLGRIAELVAHFGIPAGVFVNRSDLNPGTGGFEGSGIPEAPGLPVLGRMEFSEQVMEAARRGVPVTEVDPGRFRPIMEELLEGVLDLASGANQGTGHPPSRVARDSARPEESVNRNSPGDVAKRTVGGKRVAARDAPGERLRTGDIPGASGIRR
jgi:MinD superfamily P-loop ATPase